MEFTAPEAPGDAQSLLPRQPETFTQGLLSILQEVIPMVQPALAEAGSSCLGLIAITLLISIVKGLPGSTDRVLNIVGALCISGLLLRSSNSLIRLGADTVRQISEYGKLLLPVMTAALAAQGAGGTSTALYAGTVLFDAVLSSMISKLIIPMIYIYLCLSVAVCAVGESTLEKVRDFVKWLMTWLLKNLLYIFTGYIGITGVVSGAADAAAIKAAKLTITGAVPVVGSILSEASEAVLVSAGVMKSAAGVYGFLAIVALWIGPFVQIGAQYLLLKATCGICSVFGPKEPVALIKSFSGGLGMLLAMTGTVCLLLLISIVCFMKGVG